MVARLEALAAELAPVLQAAMGEAEAVAARSAELVPVIGRMQAEANGLLLAFEKAGAPRAALLALWPGGAGAPVGVQAALALAGPVAAQWVTA